MYATSGDADGRLYLMFKVYNPAAYGSIDMIIYSTPVDTESNVITFTDDGEVVTVYIDDKIYATVTLFGEITYDNIKAENCAPGNVFVQSATIVLADGQTHTVENTLIAAHVENSELGIVARVKLRYSEIKLASFFVNAKSPKRRIPHLYSLLLSNTPSLSAKVMNRSAVIFGERKSKKLIFEISLDIRNRGVRNIFKSYYKLVTASYGVAH
jgi:hypothetical protein